MLKNRYYSIQINNDKKTTLLIRVKKDFYTEGIVTNGTQILQGYFYLYKNLQLNILDNTDLESTIYQHNGITGNISEGLSLTGIDDEFISYGSKDKLTCVIEEVDEKSEIARKLDYLLRNGIKTLTPNNKKIYDYFNSRRMAAFKELKSEATVPIYLIEGGEYIAVDDPNSGITREDLTEIEKYLKTLSNPQPSNKGKDETGHKLRKRNKKKK